MHQEPERAVRLFLGQNARHDIVRLACVHHQRQAGPPCRMDMGPEHRRLHIARAEVVVKIQPAFADAHDPGPSGQFNQPVGSQIDVILRLVRMGPDRAPDVLMRHGQTMGGLEGRQLVRDLDHQLDAGLTGPGDHGIAVLIKLGSMEIDVAVDDHPPPALTR